MRRTNRTVFTTPDCSVSTGWQALAPNGVQSIGTDRSSAIRDANQGAGPRPPRPRSNFSPVRSSLAWVLVWACLAFWCRQATAAVIYQNYDSVTPGGSYEFIYRQENTPPTPDFGHRAAVAFTTDSSSYYLDSVTVNQQLNGGTLAMRLYSDSGGVPGSSLGLLGLPGGLGAQGNYTFTGGGFLLAAGTTYWVVLEPGDTPPVSAQWYVGTSGSGFANSDYVDGWGAWGSVAFTPPSAYIQATPVPEPVNVAIGVFAGVFVLVQLSRSAREREWLTIRRKP